MTDADLDERLSQDDWTIQPTQHEAEYLLSHDGMHVRFHAARATASDGIRQVELVKHGDHAGVVVATLGSASIPWRIDAWVRELVAETMPEVESR